ncbi:MAG: PD40 domain-containing protein, partial [Gemmatimonadota bacterium]
DDVFPSWSPNGREIAFGSRRDGNMDIHVINIDGSGLRRLTYKEAFDGTQDWASGRCQSCR